MRTLILLCCVWLASAGTVPEKCDQLIFDGKYYDREVLTVVKGASDFSYAKSTNTLYFSYDNPNNQTQEEHSYVVAYYNIDTKEFHDIPEVLDGWTTAINTATDEVYLAGNGIQKFNDQTKKAETYTAEGVSILYMYFDKTLFYIPYSEREIYSYDGEETKKVSNVKANYVLGDMDEYYFANDTGLFRVLDNKTYKFGNAQSFRDEFARDNNNKIFVARELGVYTPNVEDKKLDKVADIPFIHGWAFDKDNNIVYSDGDNIYKMTLSQEKCTAA